MNLGRLLADTTKRLPGKPALHWRGQSWSWEELNQRVDQLALALQKRGISAGSLSITVFFGFSHSRHADLGAV